MSDHASPATIPDTEEDLGLTLLWGTWELWCDLPSSAQATGAAAAEKENWLSQVKSIGLFDSAEGFWGLFNCILLPSQLPANSSYYLFRKHIAPMWEHEANRRGGKWVIPFAHAITAPDAVAPGAEGTLPVDVAWERLCLAAVGEQLPGEEMEICGVTVSRGKPRPGTSQGEWKLCLWTRNAEKEEAQMSIAHYVKNLLELKATALAAAPSSSSPASSPSKLPSVDQSPGVEDREREGTCMTFMAHRALMEAKQQFAKGAHPVQPFRPLYTA